MSTRNHCLGVVSRAHVMLGVKGGFIQLGHGKKAPLQKLRAGDCLVMYSPRLSYPDGKPCQAFTAIGHVKTGEIYQVEMSADFHPFRMDIQFRKCRDAPIKPLIGDLSFIQNKTHWGGAFRFGQLKIPAADFRLIAHAMGCAAYDDDAS
ncbi:MAG: EVE domain-containing protein [Betaproteobacteria bacterium]|nr:EVE domain-containing protein [Betaproteobacteria bacterium]